MRKFSETIMNGIKILIIGDPHIKNDNAEQTNLMTNQICELIKIENPNIIVVLGDVLHKHEKIDLYPYHRAEKFMSSIHLVKSIDTHLYLLIGNHDRPNNSIYLTDEHAFNAFKFWPNTFIVDVVKIINYGDFKILCVPYVHTGRFGEALSTLNLTSPLSDDSSCLNKSTNTEYLYHLDDINIVFAHQEFRGAKMSSIESIDGDLYPSHLPLCISGHIHDFHKLQENLIYVGTPIQHGYTDTIDKTISILDYDCNYKLINHRRIALNIPKKILYTLTSEDLSKFVPEANSQIKIKLIGTSEEIKNTMKMEYVKKLISSGIKIVPTETDNKILNYNIINEVKTKISFRERLNNAISLEKDDIKLEFSKIFGNL